MQAHVDRLRPDDAFDAATSARGRFANAQLTELAMDRPPGLAPETWAAFAAARRDFLEVMLAQTSGGLDLPQVEAGRTRYGQALDRLAAAEPTAARMLGGGGTTAEEVARVLPAEQAMVVVYPLLDRTVGIVVQRSVRGYRVQTVELGPGYRHPAINSAFLTRWFDPL